ncbi:hypothetical protein NM688_g4174 [Phlebia brevispora]|uniref:Uncharacterized protein n=1 Tax=Phlebia brevispora TaxID=194682 RepID=A0ACC1T3T1_9APHY|nr:hypothetical protein NM688_g4174 [Phlebia brevispora]
MSTGTYPIVGLKGGIGPDGSRPLRYEINKFANPAHNPYARDQLNVFLLALEKIQAMPRTERLSWFQISGIHGEPYADWDASQGDVDSGMQQWRGYCTHSSILFPTWHRLYCALVEQAVHECMLQVLSEFSSDDQTRLKPAVDHWRFPYWDWALVDHKTWHIKVPELLRLSKATVQRPSGLIETIDNPLYRYAFPLNDKGTIDGIHDVIEDNEQVVPFSRAPYTVRHPEKYKAGIPFETQTTWSQGISDNDAVENSMNSGEGPTRAGGRQLVEDVFKLFSTMRSYPPFSNTRWTEGGSVVNYNSLEAVHNNVHIFIGGMTYGHMSENEVAAFDPIFWMHHGNVERLLSIFQALNPADYKNWPEDEWISNTVEPWFSGIQQSDSGGTWTRPSGQMESTDSPLTPFHKDTQGTFYDSDGCRFIKDFGYTYEELQDWLPRYNESGKFNEPLLCQDLRKTLIQKYGWALPKIPVVRSIALGAIHHNAPDTEYVINVRVDRFANNGQTFVVNFFLGDVPPDVATWETAEKLGIVSIFGGTKFRNGQCANCASQAESAEARLITGEEKREGRYIPPCATLYQGATFRGGSRMAATASVSELGYVRDDEVARRADSTLLHTLILCITCPFPSTFFYTMPGKAQPQSIKVREARARRNKLMAEAVKAYRAELEKPEDQCRGARTICQLFMDKHKAETGEVLPLDHTTLMHLAAGCKSISEFNAQKRLLNEEEENTIVKYLVALGDRGFPLNHRRLKELVDAILKSPDRKGPDYEGVRLDSKRGRAVNPTANAKWQELLKQLLEEFNIQAEDIYGTDEMGFMSGIGQKERVIAGRGKKVQHQQHSGDRETITAIPTICADGTSIPPAVIFKGKAFQMRWKEDNPLEASLGYSKRGWTDGELGVEWIKHFDEHTKAKSAGRPHLLLVDGHKSHCTLGFLKYAQAQNIHVLCYPAHATHIYQSLDVGVFAILKKAWTKERDAWEPATPDNIKAAWEKTGIRPYNPAKITLEMLAPSLETSYQGNAPLEPPSPVRILAEAMRQLSPMKPHRSNYDIQDSDDGRSQIARDVRTQLAGTSAAFLVSNSPIKASSSLPSYPTAPPIPIPNLQSTNLKPATENEQKMQADIRALTEALEKQRSENRKQRAVIFIQNQYCDTV